MTEQNVTALEQWAQGMPDTLANAMTSPEWRDRILSLCAAWRAQKAERACERADLLLLLDRKIDETFIAGATMRRCRQCGAIVVGGPTACGCVERAEDAEAARDEAQANAEAFRRSLYTTEASSAAQFQRAERLEVENARLTQAREALRQRVAALEGAMNPQDAADAAARFGQRMAETMAAEHGHARPQEPTS